MAEKLTKKEQGFVKDYVKTGNGTQSILNNYDVKTVNTASVMASENLVKPRIQNAIKSIADRIPDELLEKVHLEGLSATRTIKVDNIDTLEADHAVRHKYLDTAYKIKKLYEDEGQRNINVIVPVLVKFLDNKDKDK